MMPHSFERPSPEPQTPNESFTNFNDHHPELQAGEKFLTNIGSREADDYGPGNRFGLKTARVGRIAYDEKGNRYEEMFPVFVGEEEHGQFKHQLT